MSAYGDAVITRSADGRLVVERADRTIGITLELLTSPDCEQSLPIDSEGYIWLAGDPDYRYRPVRFEGAGLYHTGRPQIVVCERVP